MEAILEPFSGLFSGFYALLCLDSRTYTLRLPAYIAFPLPPVHIEQVTIYVPFQPAAHFIVSLTYGGLRNAPSPAMTACAI